MGMDLRKKLNETEKLSRKPKLKLHKREAIQLKREKSDKEKRPRKLIKLNIVENLTIIEFHIEEELKQDNGTK